MKRVVRSFAFLVLILLSLGTVRHGMQAARGESAQLSHNVEFSGYLGGSSGESIRDIAVDTEGYIYATGATNSSDFPVTPGAYDRSFNGVTDAFVTKLTPDGRIVWSTYLGGPNHDRAYAIEVDRKGYVYVGGRAGAGFPVTAGSLQTAFMGSPDSPPYGPQDGFVCKLQPDGSALVFCTYFGSPDPYIVRDLAVDLRGNIYIASGYAYGAYPGAVQGSFVNTPRGDDDGVVAKLPPDGSRVLWAVYVGGSDGESHENSIRLDGAGNPYLLLTTKSFDIPTTPGAYDRTYAGGGDLYVAKLSPENGGTLWATYLGGSDNESTETHEFAVDLEGNAYIAAPTKSLNFPTTPGAFQRNYGGGLNDAFVSKISSDGSHLLASTYLGGREADRPEGVAVDREGNVYFTGVTSSPNFPVTSDAFQSTLRGPRDALVVILSKDLTRQIYSSFLGGSESDLGRAAAVDSSGNLLLGGETNSGDFPRIHPLPSSAGAFLSKLKNQDPIAPGKVLYFPRLVAHAGDSPDLADSEHTGIAVVNLGTDTAALAIEAFDRNGELLFIPGLTNPRVIRLQPGEQLPVIASQLLGANLTNLDPQAWMRLESSGGRIAGFFLMLNSLLTLLDGADVSSRTHSAFVFPEIEEAGFTRFHIVNPHPTRVNITLEVRESDGSVVASTSRNLSANGALSDLFADLFPGIAPKGSYYIRASSDRAVTSLEYFGKHLRYVEALNGQGEGEGAAVLYSPQYAVGGGSLWSALSIVNLESIPATVKLDFVLDDGTLAGSRNAFLPSRGKIHIEDQFFFPHGGQSLTQGYVVISSGGPRLAGSIIFGDPSRSTFSTALPLVSQLTNSMIFSQLVSDQRTFTGLAVLNPNAADANVAIEVYDATGRRLASKTELIPAKRRKARLLTEYFPGLIGQELASGYVLVSSDVGVAGFALFGGNDLTFMSAVPPQSIQ